MSQYLSVQITVNNTLNVSHNKAIPYIMLYSVLYGYVDSTNCAHPTRHRAILVIRRLHSSPMVVHVCVASSSTPPDSAGPIQARNCSRDGFPGQYWRTPCPTYRTHPITKPTWRLRWVPSKEQITLDREWSRPGSQACNPRGGRL